MKALEKQAPFGVNQYGIEKAYRLHRQKLKNVKKCVDNAPPSGFEESRQRRSPTRKIMAKNAAEETLQKENYMLAKRIFKIMQGESEITSAINNNEHIENHPGTMNFKARLEEAQRIHHKNLMFAIRMQSIQPYYKTSDISIVRPVKSRSPKSRGVTTGKKTKFMREFEQSLRIAEESRAESGNNLERDSNGAYQGYLFQGSAVSGSVDEESPDHGYHNKRPRTVLLQYTKAQDNRILDVVVLKEPFRDRYAIFGLDVDDGQRYELRLTSEDVSNILDGDILVTSVDNVEVWLALLNKVKLNTVSAFNQVPFTAQELDHVSRGSFSFGLQGSTELPAYHGSTTDRSQPLRFGSQDYSQQPSAPDYSSRPSYSRPRGVPSESLKIPSRTNSVGDDDPTSARTIEEPRPRSIKARVEELLENDAETAEMIRASNAAVAEVIAAASADVVKVPSKPTSAREKPPVKRGSYDSYKPSSGGASTVRSVKSAHLTISAGARELELRPAPPSRPKTPGSSSANAAPRVTSGNSTRGASASSNVRLTADSKSSSRVLPEKTPEELAEIAHVITKELTEDKLGMAAAQYEGVDELSPSQRATEEFVDLVSGVTKEAVSQAVIFMEDSVIPSVLSESPSKKAISRPSSQPPTAAEQTTVPEISETTAIDELNPTQNVELYEEETFEDSPVQATVDEKEESSHVLSPPKQSEALYEEETFETPLPIKDIGLEESEESPMKSNIELYEEETFEELVDTGLREEQKVGASTKGSLLGSDSKIGETSAKSSPQLENVELYGEETFEDIVEPVRSDQSKEDDQDHKGETTIEEVEE